MQLLKEGVESDLEVLVVVDLGEGLSEDDLNEHESEGEDIGLFSVYFGALSVLGETDHLLRGEENAVKSVVLEGLVIHPCEFSFSYDPPSIIVCDPIVADADGSSF